MEKRRIPTEYGDVYYDTLEGEMDALEGNISMLGQSLFNYYSMSFLLAGLVLLIALIGAVCLTLHFNTNKKSQITSKQLSRSDAFLSYFKNKINKK